jgi:hypothetical protein
MLYDVFYEVEDRNGEWQQFHFKLKTDESENNLIDVVEDAQWQAEDHYGDLTEDNEDLDPNAPVALEAVYPFEPVEVQQ